MYAERLAKLIRKYLPGMEHDVDFHATFQRFSFVITHVQGKRVLDVGTGHGLLLDLLREKHSITGIDIQPKRDDAIQMDATDLKMAENSFDTVIMAEVIEHLRNPLDGLCEANRVLSPNGRLILTTRNLWFIFYFKWACRRKRLRAYLRNILSKYWNEEESGWHLRFRPDFLLEQIRKAGFQIQLFKALDFSLGKPFLRFTRVLDEYFKLNFLGNCIGVIGVKNPRTRSSVDLSACQRR